MARADPWTTERSSLYERDFCLWLEQQVELLREGRLSELDVANLLEELESMGRNDKRAIKSNLAIVLLHLLKQQFQPQRPSRRWLDSILEHRQRLRDDLTESPSLRWSPRGGATRRIRRRTRPRDHPDRLVRAGFSTHLALHTAGGPRPGFSAALSAISPGAPRPADRAKIGGEAWSR
jgi:uncharacterized protein DUF29